MKFSVLSSQFLLLSITSYFLSLLFSLTWYNPACHWTDQKMNSKDIDLKITISTDGFIIWNLAIIFWWWEVLQLLTRNQILLPLNMSSVAEDHKEVSIFPNLHKLTPSSNLNLLYSLYQWIMDKINTFVISIQTLHSLHKHKTILQYDSVKLKASIDQFNERNQVRFS